jgi:hypothetical protein
MRSILTRGVSPIVSVIEVKILPRPGALAAASFDVIASLPKALSPGLAHLASPDANTFSEEFLYNPGNIGVR